MVVNSIRAVPFALASAALVLSSTPAFSQHTSSDTSEVRIEAARSVERIGRSSTTGAPIEIVQLTRRVNYSDLDLATQAGAHELEKRIKETSREACGQLDKLYPVGTSEGPGTKGLNCVQDAIDGAMLQARTAIAAAERPTRSAEAGRK